jgi:ATP-binding cassette subfamily B protein
MPAEGPLSFRNVSFGYPGREVLQDVDFDIAHRGCVALVGNNGAGKTTLVQLLLGLLRPSSGSIRYGDVQLDDIDMLAYRKSIGYVPQRPRLMPGTVRSNLAYGMGDVSDDRLYEALRLSMAEELVGRLPDGLDTPLGEEGTRLSGGERQRLAIAAAILAHPRILVLDEPTNHLDAEAIRQLIANIKGLPDSPTILFVSHNSEMLSMADRILYLSQGRLQDLAREAYLELAPLAGESPPGKSSG